nr:hypothetical protein [Tanacetum cinerariifolium]
MFRINPSKTYRKERHVLNTVSASARTKRITVSQPHVITKKDLNYDLDGLSSTGVDNTKTRRPQPRSNTKNDRVPSASKSSQSKNKEAKVEEQHRNLLLSKNNQHISSVCNNSKIDSQDVISKVVCAMCKKCLISVNHDKCLRIYVNGKIPRGMFRINPSKTSRDEKHVPNTISASARTKPITVSQPPIITKKDVNSDINGLSSTGVDNTMTRRPQPRSNTKHDRVPSASKNSRSMNKEAEVEDHHRNLLLFKNNKHISSACNNIKIDSQDVISKVVCAMCKKCLISVNHDKCLRNYVNDKNSSGKKQKEKVSVKEILMKY